MNPMPTAEFRNSPALEQLLAELNDLLSVCQQEVNHRYARPNFPILLIMGVARSGTTLFFQWLAKSRRFAYPSNLVSRFFRARYVGARVQQILVEHDYRNEIMGFEKTEPYASSHGKTKGATAPHEFWYFWRRFFPVRGDAALVPPEALEDVDVTRLNAELATLEAALEKPLAMKAMLLNWNIPFLDRAFEKVLFVHVERDPLCVMQSIMEGRQHYFGSAESWYSFKPPEYRWLKELNPVTQVAGQVHFTQKAVKAGLSQVNESRKMAISYGRFCREPAAVWETLRCKMAAQGCRFVGRYEGPDHFEARNSVRVSAERWGQYQEALEAIQEVDSQRCPSCNGPTWQGAG